MIETHPIGSWFLLLELAHGEHGELVELAGPFRTRHGARRAQQRYGWLPTQVAQVVELGDELDDDEGPR